MLISEYHCSSCSFPRLLSMISLTITRHYSNSLWRLHYWRWGLTHDLMMYVSVLGRILWILSIQCVEYHDDFVTYILKCFLFFFSFLRFILFCSNGNEINLVTCHSPSQKGKICTSHFSNTKMAEIRWFPCSFLSGSYRLLYEPARADTN
jgi:hypothetical protein